MSFWSEVVVHQCQILLLGLGKGTLQQKCVASPVRTFEGTSKSLKVGRQISVSAFEQHG